ncbi:MAG TPA: DNRLRE domain-containing protein [Rhodothermales bacterium]|nr:DNRLRE domain-containing protein [Rhodothermales bacterium]
MQYHRFALIAFVAATALPLQAQEQVTLVAVKDNTLYESSSGAFSNALGDHIFAGTTNGGAIRRGVIAFDLSAIPSDAHIESASLRLNMSRAIISGAETIVLHRLLADWGEGTSDARNEPPAGEEGGGTSSTTGDATWIHRFFSTETWQHAGGDFEAPSSASAVVNANGNYTWGSTESMVADVQGWVNDPQTNFGWILIGAEAAGGTAKRFDSRENPTTANRPTLQITYSTGVAVEKIVSPALMLGNNYPDPFRSTSVVPFELDAPAHVQIQVYDVLGRTVKTLVDRTLSAGPHEVEISSVGMTSGLYAYCYQSYAGRQCRTMVVSR